MEDQSIYINKYRKYKTQYKVLKGEYPVQHNQDGGAIPIFENGLSMYVMVSVKDPEIKRSFNKKIAKLLGKDNRPANDLLHITLLNLTVNMDHPDADIFQEKRFIRHIRKSYNQHLAGTKLIPVRYKLLGVATKFFAKVYRPDDQEDISDFRVGIYKYLNRALGTFKRGMYDIDGLDHYIYSFNGQELYAVNEFHHGRTIWVPHLSIISDKDIARHNEPLFKKYDKKRDDKNKLNLLTNIIGESREKPIRLSKKDELVISYFNKESGFQKHVET